jgi:hypothetical protein
MEKENYFIILFSVILVTSLIYFYSNIGDFECYVLNSTSDVMGDITYDFEPQGSLYGKTRIYRFIIASTLKNLEYYGMEIKNGNETLFFQVGKEPEGGSIVTSLMINETDKITVNRFFKKKCYPQVVL